MGTAIARCWNGGNDSTVLNYRHMSETKRISDKTKIENFKEKVDLLKREDTDEKEQIKVYKNDFNLLYMTSFLWSHHFLFYIDHTYL